MSPLSNELFLVTFSFFFKYIWGGGQFRGKEEFAISYPGRPHSQCAWRVQLLNTNGELNLRPLHCRDVIDKWQEYTKY